MAQRSVKLLLFSGAFTAALALTVTAAQGSSRGVRITSLPRHVAQGGLEHLNAAVSGSMSCSLTVRYANGKKQALGRKPVIAHRVAWTWRVPTMAAVGKATARVSCRGLGSRAGTFTIKRRLVPASVAVVKSGLSQVPDEFDSGTTISYGVVLVNRSNDEDAKRR